MYHVEELTPAGWHKRGEPFECETSAASYVKARSRQSGVPWRVRYGR
jgi:hypothetical protein